MNKTPTVRQYTVPSTYKVQQYSRAYCCLIGFLALDAGFPAIALVAGFPSTALALLEDLFGFLEGDDWASMRQIPAAATEPVKGPSQKTIRCSLTECCLKIKSHAKLYEICRGQAR